MLPTVVPLLRDIVESETLFFTRASRLPEPMRNRVIANRNRQTMLMLDIIHILSNPPRQMSVVPRANFTIDLTSEVMRSFHEPVPVIPTTQQVQEAVEQNATPPTESMCAICQDTMTTSTRLVHCGHHFHHSCITQWFTTSVRCPVCRNDIRETGEEDV